MSFELVGALIIAALVAVYALRHLPQALKQLRKELGE